MRYNDAINNNTHVLNEVLTKYKAAWAKKGMFSDNGLFRRWYAVNQDKVLDTDEIAHSTWVIAFMP
jgi:Linalool dehydratase/isomerase